MNAQLTPTANSPCCRTAPEARPNNEASGFQALFATASQDASGSETGPNVAVAAGKDTGSGEPDRIGKKTPGKKPSDDAGGGISALAAALLMSAPATIPSQKLDASEGETDAAGCSAVGDPSPSAGEAAPLNLQAGKESPSAVKATTAVVEKPSADLPGALPPADIFGSDVETSDEQTTKPVAAEGPAQAGAAEPKTANAPTGPAPQAVASHEREASPGAATAPMSIAAVAADGNATVAVSGSVTSATTRATAVTGEDAAAPASSSQESSVPKPTAGQRAGGEKSAAPEEVLTGPAEQKATESGQLQARFAVDPAAQKSDGAGRARWSYQPGEGVDDDDSFPPAAQTAASPAATGPAATPALAGTAPHSAAASPPPLEHTATASPSSAEANPAPAPPPLQTAQILQRMDKSEIHIGLQSADFGAIRLHTTVANDQVGAAVSTSHAALRDALLVEAPSLEKAIARHSLRLDSVDIGVGGGGAGSHSNSFGSNERKPPGAPPSGGPAWTTAQPRQSQSAGAAVAASLDGSCRLDVRA